ncbi:hypothetical protein SEUCBS139899_003357 [Sporothrix eucalyptigena]
MVEATTSDENARRAQNVGFIGLGAMGFGMASHLLKSGFKLRGFDVVAAQVAKLVDLGGIAAASPREAASDADILVVVVANAAQAESVFFSPEHGAVASLPHASTILLCATVPASFYASLTKQLVQAGRADIKVLDAPISGGAVKAGLGQLTIITAGTEDAHSSAGNVLSAMAEKVYPIPGDVGTASMAKMINQLLAGLHIAAAAEAMAFAARLKTNTRQVFEAVNASSSWSWMFENRVQHMLEDDWTPKSALDIFVKDMGIVTSTAQLHGCACHLSALAEQLYISASSSGFGKQDDAGVVRLYLPASSPSLVSTSASPDLLGGPSDTSESVAAVLQLLDGIHLAATIEAFALMSKCGLDVKYVHKIIVNAAGTSKAFEALGSALANGGAPSPGLISHAISSLTSACTTAKTVKAPVYLASVALQLLQTAAAEAAPAFTPRSYPSLLASDALARLPSEHPKDVLPGIRRTLADPRIPQLVVLDDDPTGTQTCHGIHVLTSWSVDELAAELQSDAKGCFVLTNSRALGPDSAKALLSDICSNLKLASERTGVSYEVVLRGDSTLRGHFPLEVEVAASFATRPIDGWILAPFFFQGGRYTIADVHYVLEGTNLVPAGQTPFAEDRTFGYKSSNLRDYVYEKAGAERAETCVSVSIDDIRIGGPDKVFQILSGVSDQSVVIVNAAAESDMNVFCAGLLLARAAGKSFLYRTGAAFVSSRLGISQIAPLHPSAVSEGYASSTVGGLIVAGSYVPKTTQQLDSLRKQRGEDVLHTIIVDVQRLVDNPSGISAISQSAADEASKVLQSGKDVLIMSSRGLVTGVDGQASLNIGSLVAKALVEVVEHITVRPRYFIAKGGITSSDAATKRRYRVSAVAL